MALKIFVFNDSYYKMMVVAFSKKYLACCVYVLTFSSAEEFSSHYLKLFLFAFVNIYKYYFWEKWVQLLAAKS